MKDEASITSALPKFPSTRPYEPLVRKIESLFAEYGDTHRGLGYPKIDGFDARYRVYLDVTRFGPSPSQNCSLLDVGCGTGRLLDEITRTGRREISYTGIDLSQVLIATARAKHPEAAFYAGDPFEVKSIWEANPDYVIFGGVFSWKLDAKQKEMTDYMAQLLRLAFEYCGRGLAFNVMSSHVDWQRQDLLHIPFDEMADMLAANLSRNYVFRADYGLFEYTTYVYK
jgi:SAM-dependent methyltransferase